MWGTEKFFIKISEGTSVSHQTKWNLITVELWEELGTYITMSCNVLVLVWQFIHVYLTV